MIHLGDITKISGYTAPVVDVVIGGSPCQDLSVAGKRAGLDGERSGLFMEQIRIVKEMRLQDERNRRAADSIRPRYMVWENVPGAFSSNKGEDFRIVLEELAKIKDENAVIPRLADSKWRASGCIMGDGWSVAWRVFDAQFWGLSYYLDDGSILVPGTPQRRKRIALVADFGGQSAPEILFVRKSLSRDTDESKPKRKATPEDASRSFGADDSVGVDLYNTALTWNKAKTLNSAASDADHIPCVLALDRASFNQGQNAQFDFEISDKGVNSPLVAKGPGAVCYTIDQGGGKSSVDVREDKAPTLTTTHDGAPVVCYSFDPTASRDVGDYILDGVSNPLINGTCPGHKRAVCYSINGDKAGTLDASYYKGCGERGGVEREVVAVPAKTRYIVRRLTPLECERLQGYPDGWTDIGDWTDTNGKKRQTSDAARYKALGNSIALPPWKWVLKRICACYERDATMASLFDGIGGFPYIWEQLNGKGSCLWASEIEDFPIAVTKKRIGG